MNTISLGYSLSPARNAETSDEDLRTADEMSLRYRCFLGDVAFTVGSVDLSAPWGWIPVLDFALSLWWIVERLREPKARQVFEFTESEQQIVFERDGDACTVTASYVSGDGVTTYAELARTASDFLTRVVSELTRDYPALAENPFVAGLSSRASSSG